MPAWFDTFVFIVLPNTFWLLYGWAREWQTLIGAILIVAAVRYFSRASMRASRTLSEAVIRSARIAAATYQGTTRPLAAKSEHSEAAQPTLQEPAREAVSAPIPDRQELQRPAQDLSAVPLHEAGEADFVTLLNGLRNAIRAALAAIPPTHSSIGEKGAELYRKVVAISLETQPPALPDGEALAVFEKLKAELEALRRQTSETVHAHQAWETLARINRLARELQTRLSSSESFKDINVIKETG